MKRFALIPILLVLLAMTQAGAAEYYVAVGGDDAADGLADDCFCPRRQRYLVLQPGDILTIMPGEYFESNDVRLSGTPDARSPSAPPGSTVLLRGDVDLQGFQLVPGMRYTWYTTSSRSRAWARGYLRLLLFRAIGAGGRGGPRLLLRYRTGSPLCAHL